jgi:hypothetical protein
MKEYTIDIDVWTSVEANNEDEAYAIAQALVDQLVSHSKSLTTPIKAQVKENGVEAWESSEVDN